jgi:hypothetical protein
MENIFAMLSFPHNWKFEHGQEKTILLGKCEKLLRHVNSGKKYKNVVDSKLRSIS